MVSFEVRSNVQDLTKVVRAWREGVQKELLPKLAESAKLRTRQRVSSTKQSPSGRKWRRRKSPRFKHGLMTKTRKLLHSIRTFRKGRNAIEVGSKLEYARFQHFGTRNGIPSREIFGFGREDLKAAQDITTAWAMRFGSRTRSLARELAR